MTVNLKKLKIRNGEEEILCDIRSDTYVKPTSGIPEEDLSQAVKNGLVPFVNANMSDDEVGIAYNNYGKHLLYEDDVNFGHGYQYIFLPLTNYSVDIVEELEVYTYCFSGICRDLKDTNLSRYIVTRKLDINGWGTLDISPIVYEEITWSELKTKRDNSQLIPGMQYRIIDYNTTTVQDDTQSAEHQFDVIVVADDVNKLNENARACLHSGDTYFSNAGAKLDAWELKYCLDNDTNRFAWAFDKKAIRVYYDDGDYYYIYLRYPEGDTGNKLAWANVVGTDNVPYSEVPDWTSVDNDDLIVTDDENIQIGDVLDMGGDPVSVVETWGKGVIYWMKDEWNNECPYDFKNIQFKRTEFLGNRYYYTFGDSDYSLGGNVYENKIESYVSNKKLKLNDIVFENTSGTDICCGNVFGVNCYKNTFGSTCRYNTFGGNCNKNAFDSKCDYNTLGSDCNNNTFGATCIHNTFGSGCMNNTFGNSCTNNTLGIYCSNNTLDGNSNNNTLDDGCYRNTLGGSCSYNTFSGGCNYNTFNSDCSGNIFDGICSHNTFGRSCKNNTFGNSCSYIKFGDSSSLKDYCRNIIVESGNQHIYLFPTNTTSISAYYQNVKIAQGVNITDTWKTITDANVGQNYQTVYKPTGSTEIEV